MNYEIHKFHCLCEKGAKRLTKPVCRRGRQSREKSCHCEGAIATEAIPTKVLSLRERRSNPEETSVIARRNDEAIPRKLLSLRGAKQSEATKQSRKLTILFRGFLRPCQLADDGDGVFAMIFRNSR
ncbi:MAG: hypothetical protein GWO87_00510 [Xanthomonadaceae bacterium]|nr:hypothetical protein [Rhodospirillaceae bacterium]NIA17662.1 hypothetical protein [Xanthomonadaceae bacterium]